MVSTNATVLTARIVAINGHEFVVMLNGMDLMKYSIIDHKWTLLLRAPHRSYEFLMVMHKQTNRLYILMGIIGTPRNCQCMKVLDVSTGYIVEEYEMQHTGNPDIIQGGVQLVSANGVIHRIGGHVNRHLIWNENQKMWNEKKNCGCPWDGFVSAGQLIYVKSKNIILMVGGVLTDEENGNESVLGIWRCQVATWKWEAIEVDGYQYESANQAALTVDEKNVIIVGRYPKSDYVGISILNIKDDDNYQLRHSMSLDKPYYGFRILCPVVMKGRGINVILLISGWFRESFCSKQQEQVVCPLDILKLIDKFVCQEMLHLIPRSNGSDTLNHIVFDMADILSRDSEDLPIPRELPGPRFQTSGAWNELIPIDNLPLTKKQFTICFCFLLVAYFCRIYVDW